MSDALPDDSKGKMVVFGAKQIRRIWHDEQWFFSIVDIIGALTDSHSPSKYWTAMKRREETASGIQLSTLCRQLKDQKDLAILTAENNLQRYTIADCTDFHRLNSVEELNPPTTNPTLCLNLC